MSCAAIRRDGLLYIDRHLVQEVSLPPVLRRNRRGRSARSAARNFILPLQIMQFRPSTGISPCAGLAAAQVARLRRNCAAHGIPYIPMRDRRHGIVHVIGPELGFTLPGADARLRRQPHSTHGAFGALAFGIGASECESVFATQCLRQRRQKRMRVTITGTLAPGVTVKDVILSLIAQIGVGGGVGHAIEYVGPTVAAMSMEERMTLCNMTIEAGSRVGMVAPDATTLAWLDGRPLAPRDPAARADWMALHTDPTPPSTARSPSTPPPSPPMSVGHHARGIAARHRHGPRSRRDADAAKRARMERSLAYMGLTPGTALRDIAIDRVFIGSCTNGPARRPPPRRSHRGRAPRRTRCGRHRRSRLRRRPHRGRGRGSRRHLPRRRLRMARLCCSMCVAMNDDRLRKANAAPRPRTAISKADRAGAAAPT